MQPSIFYSALRTFFIALAAVLGILSAFLLIVIGFSLLSGSPSSDPELTYTPTIVANAEGSRKALAKDSPVILKVKIDGLIGTDDLTKEAIRHLLIESREGTLKDRVKAILLYINSPGGTVIDSDGIYHAIKDYKEKYKIPVYAFVDGLCTSGGLYVAMSADKINSSNVSILGSVGVLSPTFVNVASLLESLTIKTLTLTAGKDKDQLNPLRPWKEDEGENLKSLINYYYQMFVDIVATNRPELNKQQLVDTYGAKIFNSIDAKTMGLINNENSTLSATLKELATNIGLEDNKYQVVELQHKTWLTELWSNNFTQSGKLTHEIQLPFDLPKELRNQFLYLYRPE